MCTWGGGVGRREGREEREEIVDQGAEEKEGENKLERDFFIRHSPFNDVIFLCFILNNVSLCTGFQQLNINLPLSPHPALKPPRDPGTDEKVSHPLPPLPLRPPPASPPSLRPPLGLRLSSDPSPSRPRWVFIWRRWCSSRVGATACPGCA